MVGHGDIAENLSPPNKSFSDDQGHLTDEIVEN